MVSSRRQIAIDLARFSWPAIVSNGLSQVASVVTLVFVSRFNDKYLLGSVGLGSMAQNVFGFSLGRGLNAALDMLVSQSNGAGNTELTGHYLRQAQIVSLVVSVPAILALAFSEQIFLLFSIEAPMAKAAGDYVLGTLPSMPLYFLYNATRSFLRGVKLPNPDFYVSVAVAVLHPLWCYLALDVFKWGAFGAGLTVTASNSLSFLFLTLYVVVARPAQAWNSWQLLPLGRGNPALPSLRAYFGVAVPTAVLIWSEWWVFEIMALLAAMFGPAAIAAHTAANTLLQVLFMVPLSLGSAATNIIGNAMGSGDAQQALTATSLSLVAIVVLSALLVALVLSASGPLSQLFTEDPEVIALLKGIFVPLAPFLLLDGVQTVLEGALRGLSLQRPAMIAKLVSMLGIRVGGAVLFAFALQMGVAGIWYGGLAGMAVTVGLYAAIFRSADVHKISSDVRQAMITKDIEECCHVSGHTTAAGSKIAAATTGSSGSILASIGQDDSLLLNASIVAGTRGAASGSFVQAADS